MIPSPTTPAGAITRCCPESRLLEIEPHLNPNGLKGGGYYYDFLTDDARFTLDTMKGACEAGALAANHTKVVGFVYEDGRHQRRAGG